MLSAGDLLAGSRVVHEVVVPGHLLNPGGDSADGMVKLRPLSLAALNLISKAARDDAGLIPVLMLKESLLEPELGIDDIRRLQVGLVQYLLDRINEISGLGTEDGVDDAARSALGATHLLLARHFGWTPEQVSRLTPGQVAIYLAGVRHLVEYDQASAR
ncbi:hypothetical protein [Flindersiella endophytica]